MVPEIPPQTEATNRVTLADLDQADANLKMLTVELRQARKVLLRDWEALSPQERSAGTRIVKNLEVRQSELQEFLDMHRHLFEL